MVVLTLRSKHLYKVGGVPPLRPLRRPQHLTPQLHHLPPHPLLLRPEIVLVSMHGSIMLLSVYSPYNDLLLTLPQYNGGDVVIYGGHLWQAKWWSYGDAPGGLSSNQQFISITLDVCLGAAGDWQDDGVCTAAALKAGEYVKMHYESKSVPLSVPVHTPVVNSRAFQKIA